jgi:hypothetical protein
MFEKLGRGVEISAKRVYFRQFNCVPDPNPGGPKRRSYFLDEQEYSFFMEKKIPLLRIRDVDPGFEFFRSGSRVRFFPSRIPDQHKRI